MLLNFISNIPPTGRLHGKNLKQNGAMLIFVVPVSTFNIDAKLNGAYIVMGLLYGEGDPDKTLEISTTLWSGF